jgi:hypothetical protein
MSSAASRARRLILIGSASVLGAVVLAWLSSPATMHLERMSGEPARLERTQGETATVTIESRLFGLIDIGRERIDGVRSATMVDSRLPGSDSDTPPHMVLETRSGPVNVGRLQQLFVRDFDRIKNFLEDQAERQVTLSSIARSAERLRFAVAQVIVLFLGLGGLGIAWLGVKSLRS